MGRNLLSNVAILRLEKKEKASNLKIYRGHARSTWEGEKNCGRKGKMRRYFSQLLKLGEASLRSIRRDDARAWVKSTRLSGNYGEKSAVPREGAKGSRHPSASRRSV